MRDLKALSFEYKKVIGIFSVMEYILRDSANTQVTSSLTVDRCVNYMFLGGGVKRLI